jgi:hypothetical protein
MVCPRLLAALFHRVALGFCNLLRLQSAQFAPCTQLLPLQMQLFDPLDLHPRPQ